MLRKNIFKNTSNHAPFLQKLSLTMDNQEFQTLLPRQGSDLVDVSFRDQIVSIVYSEIPFRAPADFPTASGPAGHTILNTVPVTQRKRSFPEVLSKAFLLEAKSSLRHKLI